MQLTMTIPPGCEQPKYRVEQRTIQGKIIDISPYPLDSFLATDCGVRYRYQVQSLVNNCTTEVEEHHIVPLRESQREAQILQEVDWHLMQLVLLQHELEADLKIQTPFGRIPAPISTSQRTYGSGSRLSQPVKKTA